LSLCAGEGPDSGLGRQECAFFGDLVDDVIDEIEEVLRGKKPRRHWCGERRRAWPW